MAGFSIDFDADAMNELARDLARVPPEAVEEVDRILGEGADDVETLWKANATVTAGEHGRLYPFSIHAARLGLMHYKVEPNPGMPQGGMAFEFGGPSVIKNPNPGWFIAEGTGNFNNAAKNVKTGRFQGSGVQWRPGGFAGQRVGQSAPHLDGTRAADAILPTIAEDIGDAIDRAFWS